MNASPIAPPRPRAGDHLRWGKLPPGADSLAIARAAESHASSVLIVSADSNSAERLETELGFFAGSASAPVLRLPDWETLPYDRFSPHQDLVSERLHALSRLAQGERIVLIVPIATLLQRIAPRAHVLASTLELRRGQ